MGKTRSLVEFLWAETERVFVAGLSKVKHRENEFQNVLLEYGKTKPHEYEVFRSRILWYKCGYNRIVVDEKLGASLACSFVSPDVQWAHPWFCYVVQWGEILLSVTRGDWEKTDSVTRVYVHTGWKPSKETYTTSTFVMRDEDFIRKSHSEELRVSEALGPEELPSEELRLHAAAARLVVGVCLMANEAKAVGKNHQRSSSDRPPRQGEPTIRTYQLSKPVSVDCRQSVRDYIAGKTSRTTKVQWMVRGHWRNQAYGPQMSLRKALWIEPHWQGKADAPIALRPHNMKKEGA